MVMTPAVAQGQQSYGQQQQGGILGQLLGAVFGQSQQASEQALESDWNQGRRPFEQRRATLDARIDAAVRDGSIGRREADELRREYDEIVRLESQYTVDGSASTQQRSDLRSRYRALSQRVGGPGGSSAYGENPQNTGRWEMLATRAGGFEQQVTAGLRSRDLTQAEAMRLRSEWRTLSQLEATYQREGLDQREQSDLWARYNDLTRRAGGEDSWNGDRNPVDRWSAMGRRLDSSEQNGRLTRNEAVQVRAQLSDLARLEAAYAARGYNAEQQVYLNRRHGELDQMLGPVRRR